MDKNNIPVGNQTSIVDNQNSKSFERAEQNAKFIPFEIISIIENTEGSRIIVPRIRTDTKIQQNLIHRQV